MEESAEPSTEPNNAVEVVSPTKRIEKKMHALYDSKRTYQTFFIISIGTGLFDLITDWIVCVNFYVNGQTGWGIALVLFLIFHNVVSLLYHFSEHNEKSEMEKFQSVAQFKSARDKSAVKSKIKKFEKKSKISRQKRAVTAPTSPMPPSNPAMVTKVSSKLAKEISAEVEYDASNHAKTWQIPFFLVGLGAYAASYECLLRGVQNQVYLENRYFEVLLESMPVGLITIFGSLYNTNYDFFVLASIIMSTISIGFGTSIYFSRTHTHGNPLEFRPVITHKYLWAVLGISTSFDYMIRMYAPLLLMDALAKADAWLMVILIPVFLFVMEIRFIYLIHGTKAFASGFGWLALFSSSVPYFAAVATRFQNIGALWTEFLFRNFFNVLCVLGCFSLSESRYDLQNYAWTLLVLFVISNAGFIWCVRKTRKAHIDMFGDQKIDVTVGALGTRAQDLRRTSTPGTPMV